MIPANKGRTLPPEPLTAEEARAIFNACSKRAPTGVRNRALLVLLYRAGLRVSEALSVMPKDVDAQAGTIRVLKGKGKTSRLVGIDQGAMALIELWMERRASLGIDGRSPLFCTLTGGAMKTAYMRALLPRLARRAGVTKRVHPHGLRHSFAFDLANERVPLHVVQAALGHVNLATTARYVGHLNPVAVVTAIRSREWSL